MGKNSKIELEQLKITRKQVTFRKGQLVKARKEC